MTERTHKTRRQRRDGEQPAETVGTEEASVSTGERLKAELDGLLDEIDDVLEANAEEFVRSYVQKGGE